MTHVVVTGTFDGLHPGHRFLFRQARKLGDRLTVVVARDATVLQVKGRLPDHQQNIRRRHVAAHPVVDRAIIGLPGKDKLRIIQKLQPNIIALGYDQRAFTTGLRAELKTRGLHVRVVRLPAYHPRRYKSGLIRARQERLARRQKRKQATKKSAKQVSGG
jgi:FAD synthetase